jgi:hypothetical protein
VHHKDDPTASITVDFSSVEGIPENARIGYWAAHGGEAVVDPATSYGDFGNAGITQCEGTRCTFPVDWPARYAEDGRVYPQHLHLAVWKDHQWDTDSVGTVYLV